jgi:hypothetical protein
VIRHPPQLSGSTSVFVSQPWRLPSQFLKPARHAQSPELHFVCTPHAFPHAPHVSGLDRSTSQPSAIEPLQSSKPALQLRWQTRFTQVAGAFVALGAKLALTDR